MNENNRVIFSGSSHPQFAKKLAKKLHTSIGKISIGRYPNAELRVRVLEPTKGKIAIVVQSFTAPIEFHAFEFALIVDAVKRESPRMVIGIIPWLAYSMQDEKFLPGEAISAEVIAKFLDSLGMDLMVFIDLHSPKIRSYFHTPVLEIKQAELIPDEIRQCQNADTIFIAPDKGASQRINELSFLIPANVLQLEKQRDRYTGSITFGSLNKNIKRKNCLICDDVVITGETLVESAKILHQNGARQIDVYCTHPILAPGSSERLKQSAIDRLFVSDTVPVPKAKQFDKLKQTSAIPSLAKKIEGFLMKARGV